MKIRFICFLLVCLMLFAGCSAPAASTGVLFPTDLPSSTPTAKPTFSPTPTATATPTPTPAPAPTPTPTPYIAPYTVPAGYARPFLLTVNKALNRVIAFSRGEDGAYTTVEKVFVCSVGTPQYDNTQVGTFYTSARYDWLSLFGGTYGQYATRFDGSILFHSVPYAARAKDTLKAKEYNKLGKAASMGCVRLTVADAKWIYDICEKGTCVIVYDAPDEHWEAPLPPQIDLNDPCAGWDPTDPDPVNPWHTQQ